MSATEVSERFEIVRLASGAASLRSVEHGETFHPVVGPMAEARSLHAGQSRLLERLEKCRPLVLWDVGLGAGANATAALELLAGTGAEVELHSFDHTSAPLEFALSHAEELGYLAPWRAAFAALAKTGSAQAGSVRWTFHSGDFRAAVASPPAPKPHAIFYDPYSPSANPGMWTLAHFTNLRRCASENCTLTSYSRSTAVRVTLALAGFFIGRGSATGEKDETTVAATDRRLLAAPLDSTWLGRVRRSTRAAPLREGAEPGPISDADFTALAGVFGSEH